MPTSAAAARRPSRRGRVLLVALLAAGLGGAAGGPAWAGRTTEGVPVGRAAGDVPPGRHDPGADAPALPSGQTLQGPLPGADTSRPLGLPAVLAALLAGGGGSLILRVLLTEPAGQPAVAQGLARGRVGTAD